jgi:ribosomal protein S18 acetylase RimI-like enzyme
VSYLPDRVAEAAAMIRLALPSDWPMLRGLLQENGLAVDGLEYAAFTPPCLVMVRDGEVVAFIQALVGQPYAVVTELAVARQHQRKGYGIRLLQHMETLLRASGCSAWMAFTGEKNERVNEQLEHYGARCTGNGTVWVKGLPA